MAHKASEFSVTGLWKEQRYRLQEQRYKSVSRFLGTFLIAGASPTTILVGVFSEGS